MFDLTILPLHFIEGTEQAELPGFYAANPPRRAARSRSSDQLILLLSLQGNASLSPDGLKQLLDRLADQYYQSAGSVTSALRATAEMLNQFLLDRNLRNTSTGRQAVGLVQMVVLHGVHLYMAQSGPTHAFLFQPNHIENWADEQSGGRGLGLSRTMALRYYQAEIQNDDRLLLCPEAPASWSPATLSNVNGQPFDKLRQRLLEQSGANLAAAVIQFHAGSGKIQIVRAAERSETSVAAFEERPDSVLPPTTQPSPVASTPLTSPASLAEPEPAAPMAPPRAELVEPTAPPAPRQAVRSTPTPAAKERSPRPPLNTAPLFRLLSKWIQAGRNWQQKSGQSLRQWLMKLSPGSSDQPARLSPFTMALIAIAVPVVIVTTALYVYNERGRRQLYQIEYGQAVQAAQQAANHPNDPAQLRNAWTQTLDYLDRADAQLPAQDESITLRQQAQTALDRLDSIVRLDYKPAIIGGLADTVNISQIIANSSDLYLLNNAQGRVIHAILTGSGYEVDTAFNCASGPYGAITIGKLVHMASMSRKNDFNANLLTVDESGNVLFCGPGIDPIATTLGTPDTHWGSLTAIAYVDNALYVLDPPNNAVNVYKTIAVFRDPPHLYFGAEIPHLTDAIDLEIIQDSLYVLHADGHLTQCAAPGGHCTDPFPYSDSRPGYPSSVTTLPGTKFNLMQYTQPPDPSLYMLDATSGSIYHFSLRINYQRQLRPFTGTASPFPPGQSATAMAISPNRIAFIAFGSQVLYALIP